MNEIEFMAVILARNELAKVFCTELDRKRANKENRLNEVSDAWYGFVHEVLYEDDGKASIMRGHDGSLEFSRRANKQIKSFCSYDTLEVRRALIAFDMM